MALTSLQVIDANLRESLLWPILMSQRTVCAISNMMVDKAAFLNIRGVFHAGMRTIDHKFGPSRAVVNVRPRTCQFCAFRMFCELCVSNQDVDTHKTGLMKLLSAVQVVKKTFTSQAILFPPFVALLFGWVGVLEVPSHQKLHVFHIAVSWVQLLPAKIPV